MKKYSFINLILAGIIILTLGCSVYTFNPKGKATITSIAIQRFENKTSEYGLTDRITDEIIDAFISDGTFKILPIDDAEGILIGDLIRYARKPHSFDQNDQVQEYKLEMDFEIVLKKPSDDSEIWREKMNHVGIYDVISETEEDGQEKVIFLLIENIINKTTKSW